MPEIDRQNVFELSISHNDQIVNNPQYLAFFMDSYLGDFIDRKAKKSEKEIYCFRDLK